MKKKPSFEEYKAKRIDVTKSSSEQLQYVLEDMHVSEFPLFVGSIRMPSNPETSKHCHIEGMQNFASGRKIDYPYECEGQISAILHNRPAKSKNGDRIIFTVSLGNAFNTGLRWNLLKVDDYIYCSDLYAEEFTYTKNDSIILAKLVHRFPLLATLGTVSQFSGLSDKIIKLSVTSEEYREKLQDMEKLTSLLEDPDLLSQQSKHAKDIGKLLKRLQDTPLPSNESILSISALLDRLKSESLPSAEIVEKISNLLSQWTNESSSIPSKETCDEQVASWKALEDQAQKTLSTIEQVRHQLSILQNDVIETYPETQHLVIPADCRDITFSELETIKKRLKYNYSDDKIKLFLSALNTTQIIALCGKPGTGKTTFVEQMAQAIGASFHLVEVQNNWTDRTDILGYYNPTQNTYQSTEFLEALLCAREDLKQNGTKAHLHIICLDEMNLSRVEYYFATFLSLLQRPNEKGKRTIVLLPRDVEMSVNEEKDNATSQDILKRYKKFDLPSNIRFIGTMNMDDTAQFLSPKVIDRSIFIEFDDKIVPEENQEYNISDELYFPCGVFSKNPAQIDEIKPIIEKLSYFSTISPRVQAYMRAMWPAFISLHEGETTNSFADMILISKLLPSRTQKINNDKENVDIFEDLPNSKARYDQGVARGSILHPYDTDSWSFWE